MLTILFNGTDLKIKKQTTVQNLLDQQGYADTICAVSLNKTFIPKTEHITTFINESDRVDIVQPIAGG